MNKQGEGKISWADFSGNPIDGLCLHNCYYCYATAIRKRFHLKDEITFNENWFDKKQADNFRKKNGFPAKIFVGSSHDDFGAWISSEWIEKIILVARENLETEFMFLSKNPVRYLDFIFPKNCWLGATITGGEKESEIYKSILVLQNMENKTFVSIEPLLGKLPTEKTPKLLEDIDLVILGAMTGKNAVVPKKEWADEIIENCKRDGVKIHIKENIKKYL
jgi:protein gp37